MTEREQEADFLDKLDDKPVKNCNCPACQYSINGTPRKIEGEKPVMEDKELDRLAIEEMEEI